MLHEILDLQTDERSWGKEELLLGWVGYGYGGIIGVLYQAHELLFGTLWLAADR